MNTTTFTIAGRDIILETGKLAKQADAAVLARYGETVVLATVGVSKNPTKLPYFPLTVEYNEKLYAGGRIKGSRWVKREGRPSDDVILKARLIDRSIRPLFPKWFKKDVQIIITILSVDRESDPDILGLVAVSAALSISSIPWNGPIAAVRIGTANGDYVINPSGGQKEFSEIDLVVAGSKTKITMIEAGANEVKEDRMLSAIKEGHTVISEIITFLEEFQKKNGKQKQTEDVSLDKKESPVVLTKSETEKGIDFLKRLALGEEGIYGQYKAFIVLLAEKYKETYSEDHIAHCLDDAFYSFMRNQILTKNERIDGRKLDELRPLSAEVSILPRTHGSAIFQRGDTQALTITTLAPPSLEQWLESPEGEETKRYMHHYNMPPYSVGETGRMGWPSRREIGHGALAERALEPVIPDTKDFPYTIRVVSEILSSNGSTSMASVCGSTLSLMDAGVPIKESVAGISIGIVMEGEKYKLLTDIRGVEDFNGDMDFKVAGTKNGITAIQLDIKTDGLTYKIIEETLQRAYEVRLDILKFMLSILPAYRGAVSQHAPKVQTVMVNKEKIGEVIGPGGRIIRTIIAETGCDINVDDDGKVTISGMDAAKVKEAVSWIEGLVREVVIGEEFEGEVKRILPFGAFVEVLPGKEGLVHLSRMSTSYVKRAEDVVSIGQKVKVKVEEVDSQGRINLTMLLHEQRPPSRSFSKPDFRNDTRRRFDKKQGFGNKTAYKHPHLEEN